MAMRADTPPVCRADVQWNAVALWAWDIVVDNCAICRNHIMDLCKSRSPQCVGLGSGYSHPALSDRFPPFPSHAHSDPLFPPTTRPHQRRHRMPGEPGIGDE